MGEPTFEEDFIHKEGVPKEDDDNVSLEMQNDSFPLVESEEAIASHPFVQQLAALKDSPIKLEATAWPENVSQQNAELAVNEIEKDKPRGTPI